MLSTKGNDDTMVIVADSFVLTEETAIGEIDVPGGLKENIQYLGPLELGFNIYIYADDNGVPAGDPTQPGTGILELSDIPSVYYSKYENGYPFGNRTDFTNIQVTDANGGNQVVLPAGTYWISLFPSVDSSPNGIARWNWKGSSAADPLPPIEPVIIDPLNILGEGLTDWTNITSITGGTTYSSMAWAMRSEPVIILDAEDTLLSKIAIYPNPSSDIVNVSIPQKIEVYGSSLVDITGKQINEVKLNNGILDISLLAKGVYLFSIETSEDSLTQRIIKN
ncbi:MAG: T9SS type A sorting domain-containing protein [Patiriisocius sp.]|uniref:T9SS type A sorting domain-containing protein n=1 Tax=Patiriisocius sp. TaxID=2822396 RepID=UPI003EF7A20F